MLSIEFPHTPTAQVQIDTDHLLRQFSSLIYVQQRRRTWDEHGGKVARDFLPSSKTRSRVTRGESSFNVSTWSLAKELVHSAIISEDPEHAAIRKRLGDWRSRPTATLISMLPLWMAGVLGISVTATGPMLAAMLHGIAEAGGDWEILLAPGQDDSEDA